MDGGEEWYAVEKSRLGEAFSYVLNQWDALCYYSDDGLAEADNNAAERALRAVVSERKTLCSLAAITAASVEHCCTG
ncbi:Putative transposase (identified by ISEscan HMM) [Escherichia coli]|nr:Putative transposase (identified by ISEscan HMM) [Escherichia coli]